VYVCVCGRARARARFVLEMHFGIFKHTRVLFMFNFNVQKKTTDKNLIISPYF